jgi:hypothetical protein
VSALANRFSQAVHPALPSMRASFAQAAQPPFNYGFRILKELARMLRGSFSSAHRGYVTFVGNDLRNGQLNSVCHLRHG